MHPMNVQKHTVLAESGEMRSVTCDVSHISLRRRSSASRILILVSGSAAFVVLRDQIHLRSRFSAPHKDIYLDESNGCFGFWACGGAGGWAGACASSDCSARSASGASRLH